MPEGKERKFVPSMSQLLNAAGRLPNAADTKCESFETFVEGEPSKTVKFDRIHLHRSDGTKTPKWSYKGRIFIDTKYTDINPD